MNSTFHIKIGIYFEISDRHLNLNYGDGLLKIVHLNTVKNKDLYLKLNQLPSNYNGISNHTNRRPI